MLLRVGFVGHARVGRVASLAPVTAITDPYKIRVEVEQEGRDPELQVLDGLDARAEGYGKLNLSETSGREK
ncbi:hypothetical protein WMF37_40495 [Sorangium sp. So ce291]|uniref:hypothetical protein n=1 Tax=Sorangium sp. So ce291 TaxID=3133294 RepID=UPI003F6329BB